MANESVENNSFKQPSKALKKRTSGLSIGGFVCGLIGFILPFPFIFLGPVAIILSIIALVQINKNENLKGSGFGIAGLVLGGLSFIMLPILAAIAIPNFISMRLRAQEASVKSSMHIVQLSIEDWATTMNGLYPTSMDDETPTGETLSDLLPVSITNPFSNTPINIIFMHASDPLHLEYDEISMPPGDIYIFCDGMEYIILGGGRKGTSLSFFLTSEH